MRSNHSSKTSTSSHLLHGPAGDGSLGVKNSHSNGSMHKDKAHRMPQGSTVFGRSHIETHSSADTGGNMLKNGSDCSVIKHTNGCWLSQDNVGHQGSIVEERKRTETSGHYGHMYDAKHRLFSESDVIPSSRLPQTSISHHSKDDGISATEKQQSVKSSFIDNPGVCRTQCTVGASAPHMGSSNREDGELQKDSKSQEKGSHKRSKSKSRDLEKGGDWAHRHTRKHEKREGGGGGGEGKGGGGKGEGGGGVQRLDQLTPPLNASRLRPIRQRTRNAVVSVFTSQWPLLINNILHQWLANLG